MPLTYILLALAMGVIVWFVMKPLKKRKTNETPKNDTPPEEIKIDEPVEADPEPEMPEKPLPVNCQKAQFRPAPEGFFYVDCCGKPVKGEGFQPWEKRSPVAIDANKLFEGMDLLDEDAEINC